MSTPDRVSSLQGKDVALLLVYTLVLFSFPLVFNRTLSTHETVHCVNIREMRLDGDWIIPHYGGRPWLERPPLPFWLTLPLVEIFGDNALAYRLAPLLVALPCVLMAGWIASLWFGRGVGLLAGLILATVREFAHYAVAPECDMFLCGVVSAAMTLFIYLEFRLRPAPDEKGFLWGRRPWALLAFFAVVGLANLVKGLFFGDMLILVPIVVYLLLGRDRWSLIRRYLWLPGWLTFAAIAAWWATGAYLRYPDIVELWKSDYAGRLHQGYMREPAWYYPVHLPLALFPWSAAAFFGLWLTRSRVLGQGRTPERFLWCWALAPIVFLSIPQGKHHHYLLHALIPWAILAAVGAVRLLRILPELKWMRTPWPTLLVLGVPGEIALALLTPRYPTPAGFLPAVLILWPLSVLGCWWIARQREMRRTWIAIFSLLIAGHWLGYLQPVFIERRYDGDLAFLEKVRDKAPADATLLVLDAKGPLDASWLLYYLHGRGTLLHNLSFLRDGRLHQREAYLIARGSQVGNLHEYGQAEVIAQSERSRDQINSADRYTLYHVRFHDRLVRHPGPIYISPMQATGRAPGPEFP